MPVKPIPDGYRTVTPYLTMTNTAAALDFYKRAFNAKETVKMDGPNGKIAHAEMQIGDSMIMLGDEMPGGTRAPQTLGGTTVGIVLYVPDVDAAFKQAVSAGAKTEMAPDDMFWGDRYGRVIDPFGHSWALATHKEDVAPAEMTKRMEQARAKMSQAHTAKS